MLELAIGYVIGMVTILLAVRHTNISLQYQKSRMTGELYRYQTQAHRLELEQAFQKGKAEQNKLTLQEIQRLYGELGGLKRENDNLRKKLNTESIFSRTVAENGNAVIRLHGGRVAE